MKIKIIRHYHGKANGNQHWYVGEVHEADKALADDLIKKQFAVAVDEPKPAPRVTKRGDN